jgi:hypothetical protein
MAAIQTKWAFGFLHGGALALALGATVLTSGCQAPEKTDYVNAKPPAPVGMPVESHVYWQNTVQMVPDPTRDGMPGPGLVGRLFLFAPDGRPVTCDGTLTVKLFDEQPADGTPPREIERWVIDKTNLNKMIQKDIVGYGYTMFLPTSTCTPRVTKVHMNVTFTPDKGNPLYSPSSTIGLRYADPHRQWATTMSAGNQPGPGLNPPAPVVPVGAQQGAIQQTTVPVVAPQAVLPPAPTPVSETQRPAAVSDMQRPTPVSETQRPVLHNWPAPTVYP